MRKLFSFLAVFLQGAGKTGSSIKEWSLETKNIHATDASYEIWGEAFSFLVSINLWDFILNCWSILSQELEKSTLECLRLQEKNMSLAKELAAFKLWVHLHYVQINFQFLVDIYIYIIYLSLKWLYGSQSRVSDLDLDEGEVLKLASFGNGANNKDTIDILRKSLVMRNR